MAQLKRGDRVTWVPPWADPRDHEHPDRERGVIVQLSASVAKVQFIDPYTKKKRVENCHPQHLESA